MNTRDNSDIATATPQLPPHPTLKNFQQYVREIEIHRGFDNEDAVQKCLLLGEEVGELYKAVRKRKDIKTDPLSKIGSIEEELADVLIFLCAIANRFEVDLEKAFIEKENRNNSRKWA